MNLQANPPPHKKCSVHNTSHDITANRWDIFGFLYENVVSYLLQMYEKYLFHVLRFA